MGEEGDWGMGLNYHMHNHTHAPCTTHIQCQVFWYSWSLFPLQTPCCWIQFQCFVAPYFDGKEVCSGVHPPPTRIKWLFPKGPVIRDIGGNGFSVGQGFFMFHPGLTSKALQCYSIGQCPGQDNFFSGFLG